VLKNSAIYGGKNNAHKLSRNAPQRLFRLTLLNLPKERSANPYKRTVRLCGAFVWFDKSLKKDLQFWLSYGIIKEKQRR